MTRLGSTESQRESFKSVGKIKRVAVELPNWIDLIYAIHKVGAVIATKDRDTLIHLRDIEAILNQTNENDD